MTPFKIHSHRRLLILQPYHQRTRQISSLATQEAFTRQEGLFTKLKKAIASTRL